MIKCCQWNIESTIEFREKCVNSVIFVCFNNHITKVYTIILYINITILKNDFIIIFCLFHIINYSITFICIKIGMIFNRKLIT